MADVKLSETEPKPRKMTGFFAALSPEAQAAALAYDGPEPVLGDPEFLTEASRLALSKAGGNNG